MSAGGVPVWLAGTSAPGQVPAWIGAPGRPAGTGGHQATAAERRAAYAMFTANRSAMAGLAGRPGVFASMRDPDSMSPLCRRIFGATQ